MTMDAILFGTVTTSTGDLLALLLSYRTASTAGVVLGCVPECRWAASSCKLEHRSG